MSDFFSSLFGRMTWDALPFWSIIKHPTTSDIINGSIATFAGSMVLLGALVVRDPHYLVR